MKGERPRRTGALAASLDAAGLKALVPAATALLLVLAEAVAAALPAAAPASADPGTGHSLGPPDAPVVVTEFSDFGCPYCAVFARTAFPVLRRDYIDTGRVRWLHVPFILGPFPNSEAAVTGAECAGDVGGYWALHQRLFERQAEWRESPTPDALFVRYAREAGLDAAAFRSCLDRGERDEVGRGNEMALAVGVRMTPTFFIDGRRLEGAVSLEDFRRILDEALSAAGR